MKWSVRKEKWSFYKYTTWIYQGGRSLCYGYCVNDWWWVFCFVIFRSWLFSMDTKHKTVVCFDQIVLYRLQRMKPISIMCVSSFKIGTETPIVGRYLMDETKLTSVGISQVRYKQHLTVGHCDIMAAEWIANSFKSQHGMLSKTVLEITRLVQNNRKNWPASVISNQIKAEFWSVC